MFCSVRMRKIKFLALGVGLWTLAFVFAIYYGKHAVFTSDSGLRVCGLNIEQLVSNSRSNISYQGAFGLSPECVGHLLGMRVKFVKDEAERLLLMSQPLARWNRPHCFRRAILETEKPPIVDRLAMVKREFDQVGLPLVLVGGSLIGAVRHHGFVPWDDDLDFRINSSNKDAAHDIFVKLVKNNPKMFRFRSDMFPDHWKLFILDLRLRKAESADFLVWIDIFFYDDSMPKAERSLYSQFKMRMFEGLWFPAPSNITGYLEMFYGDVMRNCHYHCYSNEQSVSFCDSRSGLRQNCSSMQHRYPFVRKVPLDSVESTWLEFLLVGDKLLQTVFMTA